MRLRVLLLVFLALGAACGPKSMKQRLRDSERKADIASSALDDADKAAAQLEPDAMDKALLTAKEAMLDPDMELYPEATMLGDRLVELQKRAAEVRAQREKKDLDKKLNDARERVVPRVHELSEALEKLSPATPTTPQVDAVEKAAKKLQDEVDDAKELFKKDPDFASWAKSQRGKADKALESAKSTRKRVQFLEGPVQSRADAQKAWKDAKGRKDPIERAKLAVEAKEKFDACIKEGEKQTKDQELATAALTIAGKPTAPISVVSGCKDEVKDVEKELEKLKELAAKQKAEEEKKEAAKKKADEAKKKAEEAKQKAEEAKKKAGKKKK